MSDKRFSLTFSLCVILLVAFILRAYQLDNHPLWFDEGNSITYARMSVVEILSYKSLWEDTNPPAYQVLLGWWFGMVGTTAFTARLFSVLLNILSVALVAVIARSLHRRVAASIGAPLLMAILPIQVYFAREAKGYAFVQAFALLIVWGWLRLFPLRFRASHSPQWGLVTALLIGVALSAYLMFGAHFISALFLATVGVWTIAWAIRDRWNRPATQTSLLRVWGMLAGLTVACLAWVPYAARMATSVERGTQTAVANAELAPLSLLGYLFRFLYAFTAGPGGISFAGGTLLGIAAVCVAVFLIARRDMGVKAILASWLLIPLIAGFAVQMVIPFFFPRFLLFTVPALALILAEELTSAQKPIVQAVRSLPWVTLKFGIVLSLVAVILPKTFSITNPGPDLREAASHLAAHTYPGDALIYSYSWQPGILDAYLPGGHNLIFIPSFFTELSAEMQSIVDRYPRVWLLTYQIGAENPINDVGIWLLDNTASAGLLWFADSQLSLFLGRQSAHNLGGVETCVEFEDGIQLCHADLTDAPQKPEREPLVVLLQWMASRHLDSDYIVFVHVVSEGSAIPVAQQDSRPHNNLLPSTQWPVGIAIEDLKAIDLGGLAAGDYQAIAGVYDAQSGVRLERIDGTGDSALIGSFRLNSP